MTETIACSSFLTIRFGNIVVYRKPSSWNPQDNIFVTVFNRRISQDAKEPGNSSLIDRPMSFVGHLKMPLWTKLRARSSFLCFFPFFADFFSEAMHQFVWHAVNGIRPLISQCKFASKKCRFDDEQLHGFDFSRRVNKYSKWTDTSSNSPYTGIALENQTD